MFYVHSQDGTVGTIALLALTCVFGGLDCFYRAPACAIANLSVRPVRPSGRNVPVSDENGLTWS